MKTLNSKITENKINYTEINQKFSVLDLLQTSNPILKDIGVTEVLLEKKNSSNKTLQFKVSDSLGNSRVLVYLKGPNTELYPKYYNTDISNDKGDVIQFITNRLQSKSQKEAIDILKKHNYINWTEDNNYTKKIEIPKNDTKKAIVFNPDNYKNLVSANNLIELDENHFINYQRKIDHETLMHPNFVDTVYYYDVHTDNGNVYKNALFQKFDNGEFKGAEIKGKYNFDSCHGEPHLCTRSNLPLKVEKVVITETYIDAISHFQLNPESNQNTLYYSSNGTFYPARLDFIFKDLKQNAVDINKVKLVLSFDNDFDGLKYDLTVFSKLFEANESYSMTNYGNNKPAITYYAYLNDYGKERFSEINNYFKDIALKLNQLSLKRGETEIIKVVNHSNEGKLHLVFPNKQRLNRASRGISIYLTNKDSQLKNKVYTDRPKLGNDNNDALKQKKLQQSKNQNNSQNQSSSQKQSQSKKK